MSQFKNTCLKTGLAVLLLTASLPTTTQAASYTDLKQPVRKTVTYKASFNDVENMPFRVLDWRNPSVEFTFDMADADWTDDLELLLSADPLGEVNPASPIMVQFNNGKPTPVYTRGQGFDARIKLDPARIRPRRNKVRFTYKTATGMECLTPQQGGWKLNFKDSFVVVKARAKSRNFHLRDIESRLVNGTLMPKSVSLLARGPNTAKLQAMAAQGIGLRMKNLPEFKVTQTRSDFEVILGTRANLYGLVTDKDILESEGPRIMVHEGRPMRLVITGDTDTEVMATAQSFAAYRLPAARRAKTSPGEVRMQSAFALNKPLITGTEKFTDMGGIYFEDGWGPAPKVVRFDVADPAASHGEILLRIASNKNVANVSRLSVNLNGESLGFTRLDKARKSVAFDIPAGALQGTDNLLTLTPDLTPAKLAGCNFMEKLPGFYLGAGSKIKIKTDAASPVTELSRFTATGAPFSLEKGTDTLVVLPSSSSKDYAASLKVLAKLAKSSGSGWVDANFTRSSGEIARDKHVLVIGSKNNLGTALRRSAPKGLTAALKGQTLDGNGRFTAEIDRFASTDAAATLKLYAARQLQNSRIRSGGVAALYPSKSDGKVIGIITNGAGLSFSNAASQMIETGHWNKLEGSIARWNASSVLMAQTALPVPGFTAPKASSIKTRFKLPEFEGWEFGEIDMAWVSNVLGEASTGLSALTNNLKTKIADLNTPNAKITTSGAPITGAKTKPASAKTALKATSATANNSVSVPALRGRYDVKKAAKPTANKFTQAKQWATQTSSHIQVWWNELDLKTSVKTLQVKTRPIGQNIKAMFSSETNPAVKTVSWGDRHMSIPAILLMLVFGGVFLLMGLASPMSRLGGRH